MNQEVRNLLDRAELAPRWSRTIQPAPIVAIDEAQHAVVTGHLTLGTRAVCLPYLDWATDWVGRTWT